MFWFWVWTGGAVVLLGVVIAGVLYLRRKHKPEDVFWLGLGVLVVTGLGSGVLVGMGHPAIAGAGGLLLGALVQTLAASDHFDPESTTDEIERDRIKRNRDFLSVVGWATVLIASTMSLAAAIVDAFS